MRPNLGQIERIPAISFRFFFRHDLDAETPPRITASLDVFEQIALGRLAVTANYVGRFFIGIKAMALHGFEMEFHPVPFAFRIDEAVSMRTVSVDLAEIARQPTIAHQNSYLVKRLG